MSYAYKSRSKTDVILINGKGLRARNTNYVLATGWFERWRTDKNVKISMGFFSRIGYRYLSLTLSLNPCYFFVRAELSSATLIRLLPALSPTPFPGPPIFSAPFSEAHITSQSLSPC